MTNPYDPNSPQDPNQPYGQDPSQSPYGGAPDPSQSPYGAPQQPYGQQPYGAVPGYGGQPGYGGPVAPMPDNNLVWAILSTVLCCLPLGIVSIVKSTQVSKLWAMGDLPGAQKAADDAKKWAIWSAVAAVVLMVLYIIFIVVVGIGASSSSDFSNY